MPAAIAPLITRRLQRQSTVEPVASIARRVQPRGPYAIAAAASLLLAGASLLYPSAPAYDPWAWIIWGREIVHLQLHTLGGPTWKPLPVLITLLFAPFGSAAPALWLLVARAGGIMAVAMAARLALRLSSPRRAAATLSALLAAGGLLALPQFFDSVVSGQSEGLLAAVSLLAILRHLDHKPRQTLAFAFAAALIRPETWPFFGLYTAWLWRRDPDSRKLTGALLIAIPALWFLPDLIGSGSLTRGVNWAQFDKADSPALARCPFCAELGDHAWPLLAAPFKVGVALVAVPIVSRSVSRRTLLALLALLAIGLGWIVEEASFTQLGFSGSERYLLAPAGLLIISGAVGWGLILQARKPAVALAAAAFTVLVTIAGPPAAPHFARALNDVDYQARLSSDLRRAVHEAGGARRLLACGPIQVNPSEVPLLAWTLDARMRSAESDGGSVVVRSRNGPHGTVLPAPPKPRYRILARAGTVTVLSRCE